MSTSRTEPTLDAPPEIAQALERLDRREQRARKATFATTALPLLLAVAALVYVVLQIAQAEERHQHAQGELEGKLGELEAAQAQLGDARRQLADFERKKEEVVAQTEEVRHERELLAKDKQQLIADLKALGDERDALLAEKDALTAEKGRLVGQTKLYESDRAALRESLQKLSVREAGAVAAAVPITAVTAPKASAKRVAGKDDLYTFRAWLDVPSARRPEIAAVTYHFDHPTFRSKQLTSRRADDGFAVQYTGWGALTHVVIELQLRDGKREEMAFNMLDAIAWP